MNHQQDHNLYMKRCLLLASRANGKVAPNPMVGCVILHQGRIIGEGYHARYGENHAEVQAIQSVKDKSLLKEATLYVNLEPCSHHGKTPPCSELIIQHHIPQIVIGTKDINPKVTGKGIEALKKNGCHVTVGVSEKECLHLNRRFFTYFQKQRPYIILKWAQTLDGYMDISPTLRTTNNNYWISNESLKYKVHRWRSEECAIFVGANTIRNDNPQLNIRYGTGIHPTRITFFKTPLPQYQDYTFFDNNQKTIIFNTFNRNEDNKTQYININDEKNYIEEILTILYQNKCQSIIIEGGKHTLEKFISKNLWDEARVLIGSKHFGQGIQAPTLSTPPYKSENIENNKVVYYKNSEFIP